MKELPLGRGVKIIDKINTLIALEKPEGILAHPNTNKIDKNALLLAPYDEVTQAYRIPTDPPQLVYLLHRLDSPTSGIVLVSTDKAMADFVKKSFEDQKVSKVYHALVHGVTPKGAPIWVDKLAIERQSGTVRTHQLHSGLIAKTRWRLVKSNVKAQLSLLELRPQTGRTHQLRVQCAQHHCAIVGDKTYGDFTYNRLFAKATAHKRLFLHASEVTLPLPNGDLFKATSILPETFLASLKTILIEQKDDAPSPKKKI